MTSIVEKKQKLNPFALHNAIVEQVLNDKKLLSLFSRNKQEAQVKDSNGNYPLYLACRYCVRSHCGFLLALIKEFPDAINQQWDNGYSNPLHLVCWFDKPNLLSSLLERNPNIINYCDERNRTPLQIACIMGSKDLVSIILRYPNIHVNNKDIHGETALHYANIKIYISLKIIPLLLKYDGINVEVRNKEGKTPFVTYLELLRATGARYSPKNRKFKIIQLFLKCNPNVIYSMPPSARTGAPIPIFTYITMNSYSEVLRYMTACSTMPAHVINAPYHEGITPFLKAARDNHVDCLSILMDCPLVDISKTCDNGRTALHYACYHHRGEAFVCLVNSPRIFMLMICIDQIGDTPLHSVFQQLDVFVGNGSFNVYADGVLRFLNFCFMRINECFIFIKNKDGHTIHEVIDAKLTIMENLPNNDIIKDEIKAKRELLCTTCEGFEMKARWKLYHYLLMNSRLDGGYTLV